MEKMAKKFKGKAREVDRGRTQCRPRISTHQASALRQPQCGCCEASALLLIRAFFTYINFSVYLKKS